MTKDGVCCELRGREGLLMVKEEIATEERKGEKKMSGKERKRYAKADCQLGWASASETRRRRRWKGVESKCCL